MTKKRIIALICVLMLIVSLMPSFTYAEELTPRASYTYFTVYSTKLYSAASSSSSVLYSSIPKGSRLVGYTPVSNWSFGSGYSEVLYAGYRGFVSNSNTIRLDKAYKLNQATMLADSMGYTTSLPSGTYLLYMSTSGSNYRVRAFMSSGMVIGYVPISSCTKI